jgi:CRISPR system Cascade subunit CasA
MGVPLNFNLCTEPWIPVRSASGVQRVSLETALVDAKQFQRLEHASPLVTVAVYRLLLAVLHRALEGPDRPEDAARWYRDGFPAERIRAYLQRWHDHFDLFGAHPFMQVPDLPLEPNLTDHWSRLSAERGSGNTSFLFNDRLRDSVPDASDGISFADAALHLLEHQTFALGGLVKRIGVTSMTAAPSASAALVMAAGDNLLETLALNLVPYTATDRGRDSPVWERDPLHFKQLHGGFKAIMRGITDRYSWTPRAIRLERDGEVVRFMVFAPGSALEGDGEKEPMAAAYIGRDGEPRTLGLREGRGLWRDFHALVPRPDGASGIRTLENARKVLQHLGQRSKFRAYVFAQANDKAKLLLTRAEAFTLPELVLSDHDVRSFVETNILQVAERVGRNLEAGARTIAEKLLAAGERKPLPADTAKLASTFGHAAIFWTTLEREFSALLERLPTDPDEFDAQRKGLQEDWLKLAEQTAWRALGEAEISAGFTAKALRAAQSGRGMLAAMLRRGDEPPKAKKENA